MTFRQWLCGVLHGHDSLLDIQPRKLSLLCTSCGHQSPGWEIGPKPKDNVIKMEFSRAWSTVSHGVSDRQDLPRRAAR